MKVMKRVAAWFLCLGIISMMVPTVVHAASAQLRFSDPSTTVGATVEVTAKLTADSAVDTVQATLKYDTGSLRFVSGNDASGDNGKVELSGSGNGASEVSFSMQFQALAEGTTKVEIESVTATAANGSTLQVTQGSSTVTIGPGDPSLITEAPAASPGGGVPVEVNGVSYTISSDFSDVLIPDGFAKTEMTYEGQSCQAVSQESSGLTALYLIAASGEEDFFLYSSEDGKFSPFEEVSIGENRYIILLSTKEADSLPSQFQETTITLNGKDFPAWQNVDATEYYLVYAVNADGKKSFYQYDTVDGTYQRHNIDKAGKTVPESPKGFVGKLMSSLRTHLDKFLIAVWVVFLLLLILLIVLAVKLSHRNSELDDLYDEYGIDGAEEEDDGEDYEEEEIRPAKRKPEKANVREKLKGRADKHPSNKKADEDDFYDFEDEEDEYEEYDMPPAKPVKSAKPAKPSRKHIVEEDEFAAYEEVNLSDLDLDDEIEDLDELLDARVQKSQRPVMTERKKSSQEANDDTFKMDFIDLD